MKGVRSVAGIVSALGWRWGVLWWAPFAVFLLLAARARLVVGGWPVDPGYFTHHDVAATWYLYLTLAQVPVLWLRTRYALAVGHRRGPVFVVMAAVTTGLMVAQVFVNGAATQLEVFLQGDEGVLVTSTGMGKMPEPGPPPRPGRAQALPAAAPGARGPARPRATRSGSRSARRRVARRS